MDKVEVQRIDLLIKHINLIQNDIKDKTLDDFKESDLLVRATCFSLVQIGEQMNRLEEKYRQNHPDIPWSSARQMRNIIVHVYNKVDAEQVWSTATQYLDELKNKFKALKAEIN